jgi:hypothetical protein
MALNMRINVMREVTRLMSVAAKGTASSIA